MHPFVVYPGLSLSIDGLWWSSAHHRQLWPCYVVAGAQVIAQGPGTITVQATPDGAPIMSLAAGSGFAVVGCEGPEVRVFKVGQVSTCWWPPQL